jgi:hypothetical protein
MDALMMRQDVHYCKSATNNNTTISSPVAVQRPFSVGTNAFVAHRGLQRRKHYAYAACACTARRDSGTL